jgi:hypothetical protein
MSADAIPTRSQSRPAKRNPSANPVRQARPATGEISEPSRLQTPKSQKENGRTIFDPETFLARAGLGKQVLNLKKKETAYAQGDVSRRDFLRAERPSESYCRLGERKRSDACLGGRRGFLGEDCMVLAQPLRLATATAMTDCALLKISKAEMVLALHQEHALSDVFVSFLLTRNARVQADLVDQLFNSSEKRLARVLLLLAQFGKESKPEAVVPKISQEVLAEMIGTTRSRVSFFMNRFRKLGFIEYNGEIRVHNSLLNIFLHESL